MGLMYSNAIRARRVARIRHELRARAEADGVNVKDRKAFAEWDRQRLKELYERIQKGAGGE